MIQDSDHEIILQLLTSMSNLQWLAKLYFNGFWRYEYWAL